MPVIKEITSKETFSVRHPVLRAGKPIEECIFEGDDLLSTKHFGCFIDEKLVGVISLFECSSTIFIEPGQFQIRGMAVLENYRSKGLGEALIHYVENYVESHNKKFLWFNARKIAVGFYQKLGYTTIGEPFEIGDVGVHYVMFKKKLL